MGGPAFLDNKYIDELDNWYTLYLVDKDGVEYASVEHYYQSHKCVISNEKLNIIRAKSPREAYRLGQECLLRKDWLEIRNQIMFEANLLKFKQYPNLKEILSNSTGEIIYPGVDLYWSGDIFKKGKGRNVFGIILMAIRSLIREEVDTFRNYCKLLLIDPEKYLN